MARKKDEGELTRCGGTMTEAQWLAMVRSALRKASLRWPPRNDTLKLARRPYKGPNARQTWEYGCAICKSWWNAKEVCVDHYPKAAGSILSAEDIGPFANNLFCEVDNLRVLCKPCHAIHTLAELSGISFEEARHEKRVNSVMELTGLLDYLAENGYAGKEVSNATKRRALVDKILRGEQQ